MLRAFQKTTAISAVLATNLTQAHPTEEEQARSAPPEQARTSLTLNTEEIQGDQGDGASSAATVGHSNPIFYAGVMVRGQKSDLVRLFELPPTERLNGEFHCAMRKRVLLQGRMYVFDHYVCFYSAVFGFAKKRRMPMRTIKAIRKKKHLGFPNSLEIETDDYKEFFTSFLSREEAYQLINRLWTEGAGGRPSDGDEGSTRMSNGANGGEGHRRGGSGSHGHVVHGAVLGASSSRMAHHGEPTLLTRNSESMGDEGDDDEEEGVWSCEPRPAPPVAAGARHVLHSCLPGSPREFFDVVLADSAPFFEDFLDSQGNRRINLTSWKRDQQLGYVRDMNFTAPIKGAFGNWGVSHTACFQSQRFCLYADEHIVFESSQTMTDIPYGDCFTVDMRWDVKRDPTADPERPQVTFDMHVRVPFTSRCLFKVVIESGSVKQVQETYALFVEQLRPVLQDRILSRNTLNLAEVPEVPMPSVSATPRLSSLATHSRPITNLHRSMQRSGSVQMPLNQQRSGSSPGNADSGDHGTDPQFAGRQSGSREPSVGRLLLSLGRRLVEGAGEMLESGIDVVLNLTQCRCTPQMRLLVAIVLLMFVANVVCMVTFLWPCHGAGAGGFTAAPVEGPLGALDPALVTAAARFANGSSASYWMQRMAVLQQELTFLQGRMELVSQEVGAVVAQLAAVGATGTTAGADGGEL